MSNTPTSPAFPIGINGINNSSSGQASPIRSSNSRPPTPGSGGTISGVAAMGGTFFDEVNRWGNAEIASWLQSARLGSHSSTFAKNDITGSVLLDVDQAALKEMGISSVGDRIRIFAAIKALKKKCGESAAMRQASLSSASSSPLVTNSQIYSSQELNYQNGLNQPAAASSEGEMEYLGDHDVGSRGGTNGTGVGGYNHSNGTATSPSGMIGRRNPQSRPPPLHLTQSAYGITPAQISPNGPPGLGLSAARGLTPGSARSSSNSRSPFPPSVKNNNPSGSQSYSSGSRDPSPPASHRKMNSTGGSSSSTASFAQHTRPAPKPPGTLGSSSSRPSTATGASGFYSSSSNQQQNANGGRLGLSSSNSSSPTSSGFPSTVSSSRANTRPSTAGGAYGTSSNIISNTSQQQQQQQTAGPLTPITESYQRTPTMSSGLQSQQSNSSKSSQQGGYSVGRGPFSNSGRPSTAQSVVTPIRRTGGSGSEYDPPTPGALSLEDLKRRTIKFIGEEGTTRTVPVNDCRDAYDVMARVLKKFGKPSSGNSYTPTVGQEEEEDEADYAWNEGRGDNPTKWGIFATSADGQIKALSDQELLAICHAPQPHDPLRERGLTLQRLASSNGNDTIRRPARPVRNKLEAFFGERVPGPGQGNAPGSPRDGEEVGSVTTSGKKMNRASTVSIMSGLGVGVGKHLNRLSSVPKTPARGIPPIIEPHRSPTSIIPRKARNFSGQRPPSELISSHLADYFPTAEKKVLERTARRSIYGRASTSTRSKRDSTWSFVADPEAPPIPGKESSEQRRSGTPVIQIGFDRSPDELDSRELHEASEHHGPPTLPPVSGHLEDWSKALQNVGSPDKENYEPSSHSLGRPTSSIRPNSMRRASGESSRSRKSLASQIRGGLAAARDRSDAASLLTVDEITQEVENRRESMSLAGAGGGWVVDGDGVPIPVPSSSAGRRSGSLAPSTRPSSGLSRSIRNGRDSESDNNTAEEDEDEDLDGLDEDERRGIGVEDTIASRPGRASPVPSAPGEESDRHRGDPMAVTRSNTSRASSVSELQGDLEGSDEEEDDEMDEDEDFEDGLDDDDDDDEEDEDEEEGAGGVYHSKNAGKVPIKWIKGALIGAGSFGNVFLGMNAKNGLLMAVKQVEIPSGDSHNDKRKMSMLEALEREIELLKTMQHENVVQYLDSYADGTHLNIFLEYVPGGSVVALLRNYGAFEEALVRTFVKQILQGLSFLHSREIVHRDIKGANILVDNKGGVKISDFGISKKVESGDLLVNRAHRPSLQGSVFWMAPEVVKQTSYTRKADIWSLGCLVVEMISGQHPWANLNQMQALFKIGTYAKPTLPDEISSEAINFLNKTFELDHNQRPSADELLTYPFITDEYVEGSSAEANSKDKDQESSSANSTTESSLGSSTNTGLTTPSSSSREGGGKLKGKQSNIGKKSKEKEAPTPTTLSTNLGVQPISTSDYEQSTTNSSLSNVGLL